MQAHFLKYGDANPYNPSMISNIYLNIISITSGQPGLVLRKVKGKMKTSPRTPTQDDELGAVINNGDINLDDESSTPKLKVVRGPPEGHNSDCNNSEGKF